jgi:hypothetical protein
MPSAAMVGVSGELIPGTLNVENLRWPDMMSK